LRLAQLLLQPLDALQPLQRRPHAAISAADEIAGLDLLPLLPCLLGGAQALLGLVAAGRLILLLLLGALPLNFAALLLLLFERLQLGAGFTADYILFAVDLDRRRLPAFGRLLRIADPPLRIYMLVDGLAPGARGEAEPAQQGHTALSDHPALLTRKLSAQHSRIIRPTPAPATGR